MKTCAICGKEIDILYPDLWRYKRGDPVHVKAWLCSWKCLRIWDDPEKRKEAEEMARMKKDGTPAAKPGRKPKAEEAPKVELVYDGSIAEEYRREQEAKKMQKPEDLTPEDRERFNEQQLTAQLINQLPKNIINGMDADDVQVTGIRTALGEFRYDRPYRTIDWRHEELGEEISLPPEDWKKLAEEIPRVLRLLGAV